MAGNLGCVYLSGIKKDWSTGRGYCTDMFKGDMARIDPVTGAKDLQELVKQLGNIIILDSINY